MALEGPVGTVAESTGSGSLSRNFRGPPEERNVACWSSTSTSDLAFFARVVVAAPAMSPEARIADCQHHAYI
jgi:hypothetical protein